MKSNVTSNTTIVYIDEVKDPQEIIYGLMTQANAALGDYVKDFNLAGDRFLSPVETTANIFIDGVNLHANGKVNYVVLSEKVGVASNIVQCKHRCFRRSTIYSSKHNSYIIYN